MKTLYIVATGLWGFGDDMVYSLIADDGEYLADHVCSAREFARGDLHDRRKDRQAEWKQRFGEYDVVFLGDDEMTEDELMRRNHAWELASEVVP